LVLALAVLYDRTMSWSKQSADQLVAVLFFKLFIFRL